MNKELKRECQERYPIGCRVELVEMDDPHPPKIGTQGTVYGHDDLPSILIHWDDGSRLSAIYNVDKIKRI